MGSAGEPGPEALPNERNLSLRVLYDHQVFSYQAHGGVSRYFSELIQGLESRGHQAVRGWLWTPNRYLPGPDLFGSLRFKGKALLRSAANLQVSLSGLRRPFDLFHPTYYDPYFLSRLQGRPFVLTIHDMTHELFPADLADARTVTVRKKLLATLASRVIAVSENTKADAVRLLGLDSSKVVVVPHGNSLHPGFVQPKAPGNKEPYWLYVGARKQYKDFSVLVKALALRGAGQRGETLVMVGGGAVTQGEAALLRISGLAGRWTQTDCSESELAGWYAGAMALVYTSRYEGFGMPLLEAMAWGCPVIASRSSCLPEVGGEAALYFSPGEADDLTKVLEQLDGNTERQRLIDSGYARERQYSWETAVERTLSVYEAAIR